MEEKRKRFELKEILLFLSPLLIGLLIIAGGGGLRFWLARTGPGQVPEIQGAFPLSAGEVQRIAAFHKMWEPIVVHYGSSGLLSERKSGKVHLFVPTDSAGLPFNREGMNNKEAAAVAVHLLLGRNIGSQIRESSSEEFKEALDSFMFCLPFLPAQGSGLEAYVLEGYYTTRETLMEAFGERETRTLKKVSAIAQGENRKQGWISKGGNVLAVIVAFFVLCLIIRKMSSRRVRVL